MTGRKGQETEGQSSRALAQALGKLIALVLVVIVVILIERYCTVEVSPFGPGAKIVSVDGDTIRAANGAEYRLFGIDAPELHQTCTEANGKVLALRPRGESQAHDLDQGRQCELRGTRHRWFGRVVAVCSAEGVPDLGEAMVRDGYAVDLGGAAGNPYRDAEAEAQGAKRGIWRGSFERPSDWRQANPRAGD